MIRKTTIKVVNEIIFWLHLVIVLSGLFLWLVLALPYVILAFVLHQIHLLIFKGCVVTKIQYRLGGVPKNKEFLPYAMKRLFKVHMTSAQNRAVSYVTAIVTVFLAILNQITHFVNLIFSEIVSILNIILKFFGL
jgi:hypothetical protein